jgi:hypothetical protein
MMIKPNDWFYANNAQSIALLDADGRFVSGDITNRVGLFDAGTEANEEAGVGMNQAPRQGRPDMGRPTKSAVYAIVAPSAGSVSSMKGAAGVGDNDGRVLRCRASSRLRSRPADALDFRNTPVVFRARTPPGVAGGTL